MLSFTRGKPVALALNKGGSIIHTIHLLEAKDDAEPDIEVDDLTSLIDKVDLDAVRRALKLGMIETKVLTKALKTGEQGRLTEHLKRAYNVLLDKGQDKLKTEINFSDDPSIDCVIPALGYNSKPFDRSILAIGASGAGKSHLLGKIALHDKRNRPVVLFSKVRDDSSLKNIKNQKLKDNKSRLIEIPLMTADDLVELPTEDDLKETICLFDDVDALGGEMGEFVREYRDNLLEAGRHKNISSMSTSHILNNYNRTKTMLNECEYCATYPNASRVSSDKYLKDRLGLEKWHRDEIIDRCARAGRYMICKMSAPNLIIHQKGLMLI